MKILFYIFGFPVHFLGLMIAIGMLAGLFIVSLEAKRKRLDFDKLFNIVIISIIAGIAGARLFYILFYNLSYYLENPVEIIKITEGGLSIHGGLATAFIVAFFYMRKHKLNFFQYADAMAPAIILGQAIGRIGCDVFGKIMTTPLFWGVQYQGQLVHPVQVYEFLLDYLVFLILWKKRKNLQYDGQVFVWYIALFSINRGIVELFRNNPIIVGWFSVSHLLSVLFIIGAFALMTFAKKRRNPNLVDNPADTRRDSLEWVRDIGITILLVVVSLVIFYTVQT